MKQKNENLFVENASNQDKESKTSEQLLYNLLYSGKISLREYLKQVKEQA